MKKLGIVKKVFSVLLSVLAIAAIAGVGVVLFLGMKLFCVQTGSMEPEYPVGAIIVVEKVGEDQLSEGDVVTYTVGQGTIVTHRIVKIDSETRLLTTKGDNNDVEDSSPVSFENVIGKVKYCVPRLGYAVLFLNTNFGRIMTGVVVIGIVGTVLIVKMYREPEEDEEKDKDSAAEE